MTEPNLIDPRKLYHTEEFPKQDQETPALQKDMKPVPDCGEESYKGTEQLANRRVLITGADSGIGRLSGYCLCTRRCRCSHSIFPR